VCNIDVFQKTGFIGANPQPTYNLLVHNENASNWMRSFWNNHHDKLWKKYHWFYHQNNQIRGQTNWKFHLRTNNLQINVEPSVSIQSMHFVFPFCPIEVGYIVVHISKQTWESEASLLSNFPRFLPLRVRTKKSSWHFFNIEFTLSNLIAHSKSSLLDRGLAEFIFPNTTFVAETDKTCFCCKLNLPYNSSLGSIEKFEATKKRKINCDWPMLYTDEYVLEILLTTSTDDYTFLSCGEPYTNRNDNEQPDLRALFLPFTKLVWASIFITIVGWPCVLSLIGNYFNLRNVLRGFDALFLGWAMILEQSHLRATNHKRKAPLDFYFGCVLLAICILSNTYKGDTIRSRTLTKSFMVIPLTHMEQVKKAGYKTYSKKDCVDVVGMCQDQFYYEASVLRQQYTDKQLKMWKPEGHEIIKLIKEDNLVNPEFFGNCSQRKALLGWRRDLVQLVNLYCLVREFN